MKGGNGVSVSEWNYAFADRRTNTFENVNLFCSSGGLRTPARLITTFNLSFLKFNFFYNRIVVDSINANYQLVVFDGPVKDGCCFGTFSSADEVRPWTIFRRLIASIAVFVGGYNRLNAVLTQQLTPLVRGRPAPYVRSALTGFGIVGWNN